MISPMITILDAFTTDQGDASVWTPLEAMGRATVHAHTPPDQVAARCAGADTVLTNKAPLPAAVIAQLSDLRYVGVMATGTNIVDLAACRERGIVVTNVPGYSTASVAQLVIALMLHFTNDVAGHAARVRQGDWSRSRDFCFFTKPLHELAGKRLLIIGAGAIGRAVARLAEAFGMEVIYGQVPGSASSDRVPLDRALPTADVISLHCPLTEATRHLVDDGFLARCKPGAILINTGRGPLIDEHALATALAAGHLGGVGLDVLSAEPPPASHPLLRADAPWHDRLAITPHVAWGTVEARQRLVAEVVANLAAFRAGEVRNRVG